MAPAPQPPQVRTQSARGVYAGWVSGASAMLWSPGLFLHLSEPQSPGLENGLQTWRVSHSWGKDRAVWRTAKPEIRERTFQPLGDEGRQEAEGLCSEEGDSRLSWPEGEPDGMTSSVAPAWNAAAGEGAGCLVHSPPTTPTPARGPVLAISRFRRRAPVAGPHVPPIAPSGSQRRKERRRSGPRASTRGSAPGSAAAAAWALDRPRGTSPNSAKTRSASARAAALRAFLLAPIAF